MDESSPLPAGREPLFVPVSRGSPMPVPAPPRLNNKHDQIMSVHKTTFQLVQFQLRQCCTNRGQDKQGHYFIWQMLSVTSCQVPNLIKL